MIRHAYADGTPTGMLEAPRNFAGGREQKRVRPRRPLANDPELPVVEPGEMADAGEVAQHQGQVMRIADAADLADALRGSRLAEATAERVTRVRRIGNHATIAQDRRRLANEPRLRIDRVDLKELGHGAWQARRRRFFWHSGSAARQRYNYLKF